MSRTVVMRLTTFCANYFLALWKHLNISLPILEYPKAKYFDKFNNFPH